ncbi:glycosyltransferase family 4 protein [Trichlorobacter ammonificans]|uniref:Glyco_trans_4-like_N domain-containing protein n=1 Tax=Trichlorobacter ammonificans TaxID=2916410 RepID=A0ABM9DAX7_9BACT|nr:glycosyltransferase family 4 protein [Trichlorobacter ammonificans]CAH2032337.1 Glyco_trans_4-like_N domain-containing protein [Trichlorobacter ammonificans]
MNIWYLSAHDQPKGQSARTYEFSLELLKRGHQVTMFTNSFCHWTHKELLGPGEKWRIEYFDGIRVVWLRTIHYDGNGVKRGANMLSNVWRSLQVAKILPDQPDVVVGPSVPLGTGWAALHIAHQKKAAFVFEVRDVWPIALVDDGGLSNKHPVYFAFRLLEKLLYRKANRISATMPFVFDHVAESGGDPDKVEWIPNGVSFERFSSYADYDGGKRRPLVAMYIGGFGNAHDVITIVKAAKILQERGVDDIYFVIIGSGPKKHECLRLAEESRLANVEFRAPIPKADIPKVQMESDILIAAVLDSPIYRFGLNLNKMFDYFASGRPVVFSGKAPNDPVAEAGAGYSIPPEQPEVMADVLMRLAALSPEERSLMGQRGSNYIKEFDMRVLSGRMESLLWQAVQDKEKSKCS